MTSMTTTAPLDTTLMDGRRQRSRSSRQRIVDAMMTLMAKGEMSPSAARVAEEAGVGLRTVFRHFDDMDAIYAEISGILAQQLMPIAMAPYHHSDWRSNVRELAGRRAQIFETMLPFRLAANVRRYSSPFLMGQYAQIVNLERELLLRQIPDHVRSQRLMTEALCAALAFQNWSLLRHDQQLTAEEASATIMLMVDGLMQSIAEP